MKKLYWILVIATVCIIATPIIANGTYCLTEKATLGDTSPTNPSLASLGGRLYIAWNGTDSHHKLNVMSSSDNGRTFGNKYTSGETSPDGPALAVHNGSLYITWRGTGNEHLNVARVNLQGNSITGFSQKVTLGDTSPATPGLASLGGRLYIAWNGTDSHHKLNVMSSSDNGRTFGKKYTSGETSPDASALVVHNGSLYVTWRGTGNQRLNVAEVNVNPLTQFSLNVPMHAQETSNWCWAASGQMIMDFLGRNVAQCTEANNRFGRSDCCSIALCPNPVTPTYVNKQCIGCPCPGWPEFNKYGFDFSRTSNKALSWDELNNQIICLRRPVAFSWGWTGGGGHMMVARGLRIAVDGTEYVEINDPWSPCSGDHRFITYTFYDQFSGDHTHWDDYYNIRRR
jgi:hypothetical protein